MIKYKKIILLAVLGILIIAIPDYFISKYSYPIVEGWWELLAIESKHKHLYEDLYFSMPPLYIDTLSFLFAIDMGIYEIRIIFIFIHILEFLVLSYFIGKFSNYKIGIISALFSELLIIAYHVAYLPKDYHMLLGFLVSIYLALSYSIVKYKNFYLTIFLGFIVSLILLTKQNVGGILFLTTLVMVILGNAEPRQKTIVLFNFIGASLALLLAYSFVWGFEWTSVYIGNDAKGGLLRVFARFFFEKTFKYSIIFVGLFYGLKYIQKKYSNFLFEFFYDKLNYLFCIVSIYLIFELTQNRDFELIVSIVLSLLIINFLNAINPNITNTKILNFGILSIVPIAIIYCNAMTAGFNYVGSQICVAIFFMVAFKQVLKINKKYFYMSTLVILLLITQAIYGKLRNGSVYQWWGYSLGSVRDAGIESTYPSISGINLSKETADIFLGVENALKKSKSKNIYFYPNIPYFYRIFNIPLETKFPILWFDTVPSKFNFEIIEEFKNIDPEYVVWLRPPNYAYAGHASLTGKDSLMTEIDSILLNGVNTGKYTIDYVRPIGFSAGGLRDLSSPISVSFVCKLCKSSDLENDLVLGLISGYSYPSLDRAAREYITIGFPSGTSFIAFCEKYRPLILSPSYPVFMILKNNLQ